MGCGSSSLKGEQPGDIANAAPQPIKKVQTNFSTIDYDSSNTERRDTVYAPHESIRQKSEVPPLPPVIEKATDSIDPSLPTNTASSTTAGSVGPSATHSEGLAFDNKISDQPEKHILASAKDDSDHKAPYQDVTASPITPGETHNLATQLADSSHTSANTSGRPAQ